MDGTPRLLVWNYTAEEKQTLDRVLKEIKAPAAVSVDKNQGHVLLSDIIHHDRKADKDFGCDEKILLFYNIPQKGVLLLIQVFKTENLPAPIYAVVTEHSIRWPFSELAEHLIEERNRMEACSRKP